MQITAEAQMNYLWLALEYTLIYLYNFANFYMHKYAKPQRKKSYLEGSVIKNSPATTYTSTSVNKKDE